MKEKEPPAIYILARVRHEEIPYGFVYMVRETVRDMLKDFKNTPPALKWYDGYSPDINENEAFPVEKKSFFWSLGNK